MSRPELREWLWRCACCDYNPRDWTKCACGMNRPPLPGIAEGIREGMERVAPELERLRRLVETQRAFIADQAARYEDHERLRRLEAADLAFYALIERQDAGEEIAPDEWVAAMKAQRACQVEARAAAKAGKEGG